MFTESDYTVFIKALRNKEYLGKIQDWKPIWVRIWEATENPAELISKGSVPDATCIAPSLLGRMWHENWLRALSVSVPQRWIPFEMPKVIGAQTRCVFRCRSGELQERNCSETTEDYLNCWLAVERSCKD
jgi:hypothetical protein